MQGYWRIVSPYNMHVLSVLSLALGLASAGAVPRSEPELNHLARRAFGPISTNSPNGVSGGTIANDAPPVNSFMRDLKPPVRHFYTK